MYLKYEQLQYSFVTMSFQCQKKTGRPLEYFFSQLLEQNTIIKDFLHLKKTKEMSTKSWLE